MKKIILVDGNNLMYRSYYATMYKGSALKNSSGFPTNALYGFVSMINKIVDEERPTYMAVAFDIGKNFRHEKYLDYKAGRKEIPEDLLKQMPIAKNILKAMGIVSLEKENYEADDIIGTIVKMCLEDKEFDSTIVSSDHDLLQLINNETDVKLLKQKDYIRYNEEAFIKDYGIKPINIIDLKALAGDSSDNIPGVKGIGDKTALTLLQEYKTLDGVYENLDNIKGAIKNKLINDKENAYFSKELATIYQDVPLNIKLEDLKYGDGSPKELKNIFMELDFYSFLKNIKEEKVEIKSDYQNITNLKDLNIINDFAFFLDLDNDNYHNANIIGMSIYDGINAYYLDSKIIKDFFIKYQNLNKYTFDLKKTLYVMKKQDLELQNTNYDLMIASYLLNYSISDDIAYLMNKKEIVISTFNELLKNKFNNLEKIINDSVLKAKYIFETRKVYLEEIDKEEIGELFYDIELPLISVLTDMEYNGIYVDKDILKDMQSSVEIKLDMLSKDIYDLAGEKFNISSPLQLGNILFGKLGLPGGKKNARGFKTDIKVLHKLYNVHPIIEKILEYRNLDKLNSTYLSGLDKYIGEDKKIHTIFKQNLTRTGRLSSVEPNIQNIPVREEEGRKIRKAFLPSANSIFLCADYSQIELRILAHISEDEEMMEAFNKNEDIHTKVASDIFGVPEEAVSKSMRKSAKAVIFGIVYGISGFGLGENLEISSKDAKKFIDKYYEFYPKVKKYMDDIVIKAREDGYVKTLFNRKRIVEELNSDIFAIRSAGERIALNTPIQGTSADIIKKAMVEIAKELKEKKLNTKMLLQVHDELIFDTPCEEIDKVKLIIEDKMENVIKLKVPIKVEVDEGNNWYEAN